MLRAWEKRQSIMTMGRTRVFEVMHGVSHFWIDTHNWSCVNISDLAVYYHWRLCRYTLISFVNVTGGR
jgi:hypothetical protein